MSDVEKSGFISKVIGDKKRWRAYKARTRQLPRTIARRLVHDRAVPDAFRADRRRQRCVDVRRPRRPVRAGRGGRNTDTAGSSVMTRWNSFRRSPELSEGGYITSRVRKRLIDAVAARRKRRHRQPRGAR